MPIVVPAYGIIEKAFAGALVASGSQNECAEDSQGISMVQKDELGSVHAGVEHHLRVCVAQMRELAEECARNGWEQCQTMAAELVKRVEDVKLNLGDKGARFQEELLGQVHTISGRFHEEAIAMMPHEVTLRGRRFLAAEIQISYKAVVTGSFALSLEAFCKVVGQGEIAVSATYAMAED